MQEKTIQIGKNTLFYKEFGKVGNECLLILHGWGGSSESWLSFSELLEESYHIVVPDLPGFGKTEILESYTLEKYAELVENFVEKLGLKDCILLGHSNGGAIATQLSARGKTSIKKLVLNNSAGIRSDKKRGMRRKVLGILSVGKYIPGYQNIRPYFLRFIGAQDYLKSEENIHISETYKNMISSDLQEIFPKIKSEVLMIWGRDDTYTPVGDAYRIEKLIPNSQLVIIEGEKHGIHLCAPEKLKKYFIENI